MTDLPYVWLILTGISAGILSGLFGIGGGIILVPILVTFFGMSQSMASGTSLVALLLPVGALGVWEYYRSGRMGQTQIEMGLIVGIGLVLGAYLGARLAGYLPELALKKGFAIFLAAVAIRMWMTAD
jgi:uncharacterized membrane protein YfcA